MPVFLSSFFAKLGTTGLIIAGLSALLLLSLVNTYVSIHIPIPLLPDIRYEGWKPRAERLQDTIDKFDAAQKEAGRLAKAAVEAKEAEYRQLAERIDDDHERAEKAAMDAASRFIAANRVRPDNRGSASPAPASAESGNSPSSDGPSGEAVLVAVTDDDIHICTANTIRLEAAREWALSLGE